MTSAAWIAAVLCSLIVATLIRDGLHLRYEVTGWGPALLLPAFNFRWGDYLDIGLLPATGLPTWRATWSP
jgi:hypothetical protein